jgi:hypothetical protein
LWKLSMAVCVGRLATGADGSVMLVERCAVRSLCAAGVGELPAKVDRRVACMFCDPSGTCRGVNARRKRTACVVKLLRRREARCGCDARLGCAASLGRSATSVLPGGGPRSCRTIGRPLHARL